MKNKITKEDFKNPEIALEYSIAMWKKLAKSGDTTKAAALVEMKKETGTESICGLCSYDDCKNQEYNTKKFEDRRCKACCELVGWNLCSVGNSPYAKWLLVWKQEDKKKCAQKMVDLLEKVLRKVRMRKNDVTNECTSCGSEAEYEMCPKSQRDCGHHCNHVWSHDACCWCGKEWGENED